jgi:hypothetical protein
VRLQFRNKLASAGGYWERVEVEAKIRKEIKRRLHGKEKSAF